MMMVTRVRNITQSGLYNWNGHFLSTDNWVTDARTENDTVVPTNRRSREQRATKKPRSWRNNAESGEAEIKSHTSTPVISNVCQLD